VLLESAQAAALVRAAQLTASLLPRYFCTTSAVTIPNMP
jgi:hypothetical protein